MDNSVTWGVGRWGGGVKKEMVLNDDEQTEILHRETLCRYKAMPQQVPEVESGWE